MHDRYLGGKRALMTPSDLSTGPVLCAVFPVRGGWIAR